jgi:hypothetical protein
VDRKGGARGQNIEPWIIIFRPGNLMEFAFLDFQLFLDQWPLYSFYFLLFRMGMSDSFSRFHRSTEGEEFCPRNLYPESHRYLIYSIQKVSVWI